MKRIFKSLFYLFLITIFINGCTSVRDGLTLKKKENSQQFLIEKKKPLVMPPDFDKLPTPGDINPIDTDEISKVDEILDLDSLIKSSKNGNSKNSGRNDISSEIEKKINKELNKN